MEATAEPSSITSTGEMLPTTAATPPEEPVVAQPRKISYIEASSIMFEEDLYKEEKLREKINLVLKIAGNDCCVECNTTAPEWASCTLGCILCITCSGVHRNLGVHITRVKSLFLDNWKKDELEVLRDMGNQKSRATWESNPPLLFNRPKDTDTAALKEQFIQAKYVRKEYSTPENAKVAGVSIQNGVPCKEGWMTKRGGKRKNWKRRWFVLIGSVLTYYKKQQKDVPPQGVVELKDARDVECVIEPSTIENRNFGFRILTPSREYFICAENAQEMFEWIQSLRGVRQLLCTARPSGKTLQDVNVSEVSTQMKGTANGTKTEKRKVGKKMVDGYSGTAIIDWLLQSCTLGNRTEAIQVAEKMISEGLVQNVVVPTNTKFVDDNQSFYQPLVKA